MRRRLVFLTLLALHVGLRLAVWLRPVRELDDLVLPDDAYLSLHLARSIAHGLGPFYGLAPTNGFQPLYVFLISPVFAFTGGDALTPVRVALLLLVAADACALALTLRVATRLGCSSAAVVIAGLTWAVSAYSVRTSLNGLETTLAAAAIAATLLQWQRVRAEPSRAGPWVGFGALMGAAYLARIDSLLLAPALVAPMLWRSPDGRSGVGRPGTLRDLALAAAAGLAVALPWLAYSWHWTHDLFPISGRALRYMNLSNVDHAPTWSNTYAPMLMRALRAIARNLGFSLVVALAVAWAAARGDGSKLLTRMRTLLPLAAFGALLVASYAFVVFGPWYFARYFYPLIIATTLAIAIGVDELRCGLGARRRAVLWAVATIVVLGSVADPRFRALFAAGPPPPRGYLRIGQWAREHFPPGTVIGGSQTGALGYFADRQTVVNLDGVVNRDCYEAMRRGRMLDYIRGARVRYLLWQDDIEMIARETRGGDRTALTPLGRIPGIVTESWPWWLYRVEPRARHGAGATSAQPP